MTALSPCDQVRRSIVLREWQKSQPTLLTIGERDALRSVFHADIQPTTGSDQLFDIRPGNIVGVMQVGGRTITVLPKIQISGVLFLLSYSAAPDKWSDDPTVLAQAHDFSSGIVALYLRHAEAAIARGLLHGYHREAAERYAIRGRIDLTTQIRRRPGIDLPIALRFHAHDEDITENRLVLAAARALSTLPLRDPALRRRLHRVIDTLADVTSVHFQPRDVPAVTWTRLNEHYRPAVELSRLLLRRSSPELAEGSTAATGLALDLSDVFEDFVRTALREALRVTPHRFPSGDTCPPIHLDERHRVRLKPDLSLWRGTRCLFIGDVKYKRDDGGGIAPDLYQLLTYATAARLDEATLIYAYGPAQPARHIVTATGTRLNVLHVHLWQPPRLILQDIRDIARSIPTRIPSELARP